MDVLFKLLAVLALISSLGCSEITGSDDGGTSPPPFDKVDKTECDNLAVKGEYLVQWKSGRVTVENALNDKEFVGGFMQSHKDEIVKAEPHYRIQLEKREMTVGSRGWGGELNWGIDAVEVDEVWQKGLVKEEILVAVIDSGVDIQHPELVDAIAVNADEIPDNGIDDDDNGYIDDVYGYDFVDGSPDVGDYTGHGTHVAGVIAAQHDKGKVLGVAPDTKILPLAFISANGGGLVSGAMDAIQYAADRGARVINASWGGRSCSTLLQNRIASLADQNILFVSAAGNSGNDLSIFPEYPAAFGSENAIAVGASTYDDKMAGFSNYGLLVDIVAPGANIQSTYPPEYDSDGELDGVVALDGTSMATPYVAGAAALLWSIYPEASFKEVKAALLGGVKPGPYHVNTRGQLNIPAAVDALNN